ncbi:MAG: bifunctional metallophosphatase/5'-nucleotidase [Candidatus Promineifilaceae bacterium]
MININKRLTQTRLGLGCAFLILLLLVGCQQSAETPTSTAIPIESATLPSATATPEIDPIRTLTLIYTNDEHGWMEGVEEGRGAAEIVSLWREDGCEPATCLILSGGDMWTGPAISSWTEGASMADVMDEMGYAAAAVGNHEFDFGLEQLKLLAEQSTFPFLSANIRYKDSGEIPTDLGIQPFTIVERSGIQIGIIGLTTQRTPQTTLPTNVAEFDFIPYADALKEVIPQAQAAGAEMIVVPGHICSWEVAPLVRSGLDVHVLGGGHCNELQAKFNERNGIISLIGGSHLQTYAFAKIDFDVAQREIVSAEVDIRKNSMGRSEPLIADTISEWQAVAAEELDVVIGYLEPGLARRSAEMQQLVVEAWLAGVPSADIAATNLGGFRQALDAGDLSVGDVVGMLPFNNVLVEVEMTGEQFSRILGIRPDIALGGVTRAGVRFILDATGERLEPDETYTVLVTDFMYAGGDELGGLAEADPDAYNTAIDWRQPVLDWIEGVGSSAENPLNTMIGQ